ncbi:hypothetical protein CDAR_452471 [Caerostris darwini]|uniref:Uncharacterized protein n=1 Tax=Caerostris darwini TaxID=1538125 RepID=A0AAV4U7U5_9ARAC|nr:hypothetical protein CDAR_452471 [Caerostris darwini]
MWYNKLRAISHAFGHSTGVADSTIALTISSVMWRGTDSSPSTFKINYTISPNFAGIFLNAHDIKKVFPLRIAFTNLDARKAAVVFELL